MIVLKGPAEVSICLIAAATCGNPGVRSVLAQEPLEELVECFSALGLRFLVRSTAFHEDANTHQRVPPSCPLVQSVPRLYSSSHTLSRSGSSRRNVDAPFSFSQTTTASAVSVNSSMSVSECVVTINCMRVDASKRG